MRVQRKKLKQQFEMKNYRFSSDAWQLILHKGEKEKEGGGEERKRREAGDKREVEVFYLTWEVLCFGLSDILFRVFLG